MFSGNEKRRVSSLIVFLISPSSSSLVLTIDILRTSPHHRRALCGRQTNEICDRCWSPNINIPGASFHLEIILICNIVCRTSNNTGDDLSLNVTRCVSRRRKFHLALCLTLVLHLSPAGKSMPYKDAICRRRRTGVGWWAPSFPPPRVSRRDEISPRQIRWRVNTGRDVW